LTASKGAAINAAFRAVEGTPNAFMVTPAVVELIAVA
jgi:hypothetical protein